MLQIPDTASLSAALAVEGARGHVPGAGAVGVARAPAHEVAEPMAPGRAR